MFMSTAVGEFQQRIQPLITALEQSIKIELNNIHIKISLEINMLQPQFAAINFTPSDYNPPIFQESRSDNSLHQMVAYHQNLSEVSLHH